MEGKRLYVDFSDTARDGVTFRGRGGTMHVRCFEYATRLGSTARPGPCGRSPSDEFTQFVAKIHACRDRANPMDDILEGHLSSALCHLGSAVIDETPP